MIIPDLDKRVAWYQSHLQPEDAAHGVGIAEWIITAEYVPGEILAATYGTPVWGTMGSPGSGGMAKLTPEDVAAKRAHILIRTPVVASDLAEIDRTLIHELGHVLAAKLNLPREAEEEVMHSIDNLCSKLLPEEGLALARAITDPNARAYRAEKPAMPDPVPPEKPADKPAEKPAMQAARPIADIEKDLLAARLAGSDTAALLDEWLAAKMAAPAGDNGPPSAPVPVPPVGMSQDQAYARGKAEAEASAAAAGEKKLVERFVASVEGLSEAQRAVARKMSTLADAEEAVKSYKQPGAGATLGVKREDLTKGNGGAPETAYARMRKGPTDPMVREALGLAEATPGAHGIGSAPAHILTMSFHEQSQEYLAKQRADIAKARSAA